MGTWGVGLFSDDMARDIRDFYRELIEDGVEDTEATRQTLEKFRSYLDDPDEGAGLLIALAVTQSRIGRLDPDIRGQALAALAAGDILALRLPHGAVLLRVVLVKPHRRGETPYLERLDFDGSEIPSAQEIERLEATGKNPVDLIHASSGDLRFTAFTGFDKIGWKEAGFVKAATIGAKPGDDQAHPPSYGVAWSVLAQRYLRQSTV